MIVNSKYNSYLDFQLDMKVFQSVILNSQVDLESYKQEIIRELEQETPIKSFETMRYQLSDLVSADYVIEYNNDMSFTDNELLVDFDEIGGTEDYDIADELEFDLSDIEDVKSRCIINAEYSPLSIDKVHEINEAYSKFLDSDLEEFNGNIAELEREIEESRLSSTQKEEEISTQDNKDEVVMSLEEEVIDFSDGDDSEYAEYDIEDNLKGYSEDEELDDTDYDEDDIESSEEDEDYEEETYDEYDEDDEDSVEYEDDTSDTEEEYYEEDEEYDTEEDEDYEEYDLDNEDNEEEYEDYDEEQIVEDETNEDIEEDDEEYDEEEIVDDEDEEYEEGQIVEDEEDEDYEEDYEEYEDVVDNEEDIEEQIEEASNNQDITNDVSIDDFEPEFDDIKVEQKQVQVEKPSKPEIPKVETPEVKEEEPKDLIQFIRKHPRCEVSFALQYFSKKEIEKNIMMGRIIKKGNKLYF